MALNPILWALTDAPVDDAQTVLILVAMAEYAHPDGTNCYPSVKEIAKRGRCSERTVQRRIKDMLADGIIHLAEDQSPTEQYRADRRPVVYELDLSRTRGDNLSPPDHGVTDANGVTPETERGDTGGMNGVTLLSPEPKTEPRTEPTTRGDFVATLPVLVEAEKPKRRRKSPEIPLPDDWKPKPKHDAFAREKGIDLPTEAMKFRNHAATHDRRCVRWDAAFDNWLIASLRYSPPLKVVPDDDDRPYVPYGTRPFVSRWG